MLDIYSTWRSAVERTARYVARDFPGVEQEDLQQDLWGVIIEQGWTEPDDKTVLHALRTVARVQAYKYRTEQLSISPQYAYQPSEVRSILKKVFDHQDWPRRSVSAYGSDGDGKAQWGLLAEEREGIESFGGFNRLAKTIDQDGETKQVGAVTGPAIDWDSRLAGFVDVKLVWERLHENYKAVIFKYYALGWEPEDNAQEKQLSRAIDKLVNMLNYYRGRGAA